LKRWERDPLLSVEERSEVADVRAAFERALDDPPSIAPFLSRD
jgi:hypothetical protein